MTNKLNLSRRQLFGAAGGILGTAALSSLPTQAGVVEQNPRKAAPGEFTVEQHKTDVLIIGGGMAGLFAAVNAHDNGAHVTMVSKGRLGASGLTPHAKRFYSFDKDNSTMSVDDFVKNISKSSVYTNNPVFTRQLAEHSAERIYDLKKWGFFNSPLYNESFMRPINEREIPLHERVMITHLLKEKGRVVGASGFSLNENKVIHFHTKTTILCTGAGAFKPNGYPISDLTHDGTIMAYKIGAKVTGKEWNDGRLTTAEDSGSSYDNWNGRTEQMPSVIAEDITYHHSMALNYEAYTKGGPVTARTPEKMEHTSEDDAPHAPEGYRSFDPAPAPDETGGLLGLTKNMTSTAPDPNRELVGGSTAGMAMHKAEGLVPIDEAGLTTLPGLYAAGDALGSYMQGCIFNQMGAPITGSAVQGAIAGEAAAKASKDAKDLFASHQQLKRVQQEMLAPLVRERGYSPAWVTQVLQGVMIPNFVLYMKKERMMQGALAYVEELRDHHVPMLVADDLHRLRLAHETENMIITAEMKLKASIMRTESRCGHYRLDYPEVDIENWQAWINMWQDEKGGMQFEKQNFDAWPASG
ncbi:Ferredoxin--NADP reductase [Pseudovibrio axinellae]|uniref:Ferredoxin--NADP reductase n=1 Tax=Pseudovibrio axinellae TaxID=989403 RepID=A0A165ZFT5_9HYPH|nr:FAD-binding protein [Pseudovibrio axinellae]KZL19848.1 Ferredoxin--NADP reductase [Pseudovibrio axinellae]SER39306.1 Succinate dehydrogenase/fumarate reductase, flavoprotein subunit [Pseudovibrio axinellae]